MVRKIAENLTRGAGVIPVPHIITQASMNCADEVALPAGSAWIYSNGSPDGEGHNEDAAGVYTLPDGSAVLAVADGVGGLPAGESASAITLNALGQALSNHCSDNPPRNAILNGFESANHSIRDTASGAATTLIAVEITGTTIRPYHVGDSGMLLTGQRGRIKWQTISHSPVGHAIESGMLNEEEALHHDERHLVSNLVGTEDMRIEIGPSVQLNQRDTILIASDGLFDNLSTDDIVQMIRKGPLEQAAERLINACAQRMNQPEDDHPHKPDDTTFILYRPAAHFFGRPVSKAISCT